MKKIAILMLFVLILLCGCAKAEADTERAGESTAEPASTTASPDITGEGKEDTEADTTVANTEPSAGTAEGNETQGNGEDTTASGEDSTFAPTVDPEYKNDIPEYYHDKYIRTPADVKLEMYTADFWKDNSYNKVIMTLDEIERYNSRAAAELGSSSIGYYTLDSVPSKVSREFVLYFAEDYIPAIYNRYYVDGSVRSYAWWENVIENTNIDAVASATNVKYGYSVAYSTLRRYPVSEFMSNKSSNQLDDVCATGALRPYQRVIVIHESADGKWYYALTDSASGWIKKEEVAFCRSRSDWTARSDPKNFLVVTGKELRMSYEFLAPEYSGLLLPMGTVLPLVEAKNAPEYVNDRLTYGNYVVKVPTRGSDGYIVDEYALIPLSADVHVGYMKYTRNNVLELAFKFVGDIYGFKGTFYSVNCSGLTSCVFSCFGLRLPGLASNQQRASGELERIKLEDMSIAEKKAVLDTVDAGTLLFFTEHIMIYLGEYDGEYYCISATAGYHGVDGGTGEAPFLYNVSVNTLEVYRSSGLSWFEELWSIQLVQY